MKTITKIIYKNKNQEKTNIYWVLENWDQIDLQIVGRALTIPSPFGRMYFAFKGYELSEKAKEQLEILWCKDW